MKHQFKRDILKGLTLPMDAECAAQQVKEFYTYQKPDTASYSSSGRRLNHYMLGADPEFMFVTSPERGGDSIQAVSTGLRSALAFGADQNDRLVELRPAPSRSALEVLASTLGELRWLYRYLAQTPSNLELHWVANAFIHGDGMGGHVHFGRKRQHREGEVAGLDGLAKTMRAANLFDSAGWTRRVQGDQFRQVYGAYGDIRVQRHGYEYRTLPTWLDNPRLGFLVLALSKLVVVDPDITTGWKETKLPSDAWKKLQGLAKYYKGRDDDALLLYSMMDNAIDFMFQGGDFRLRWGLKGTPAALPNNFVIPGFIEAGAEDVSDLYLNFTQGTSLPMRELAPTWKTSVPNGFYWVPLQVEYRRRPNIGDLLYDLVYHKTARWNFDFEHGHSCVIHVPKWYDTKRLNELRGDISVTHSPNDQFHIRVGQEWRKGANLSHLRKVLLSGVLPLWTVDDVHEKSHLAFDMKPRKPKTTSKYLHVNLVGAA